MTEIYLIRHAQAEGNIFRMMQGQWDGDLTSFGLKQIDALSRRLRDVHFDAVYASDLYRTRKTASAITLCHNLPLNTSKNLREINLGPWETRFMADLIHEDPKTADAFFNDPENWHVDGAEAFSDVAERVYAELVSIAEHNPGKTVAAVSHGAAIRSVLSKIMSVSYNDSQALPICSNTSITKLIWTGEHFEVEYINDYEHLKPLGGPAWNKHSSLRAVSIDPAEFSQSYCGCYEDAWRAAHGSTKGFNPGIYLDSAIAHHKADADAVLGIYNGDEPVGLVDMDTGRGQHSQYGWISLIYLKEDYRCQGYGIQLLARPIIKYMQMGRNALRLHVAESNKAALAFYKKYDFKVLSYENTDLGRLYLMERRLGGFRDE